MALQLVDPDVGAVISRALTAPEAASLAAVLAHNDLKSLAGLKSLSEKEWSELRVNSGLISIGKMGKVKREVEAAPDPIAPLAPSAMPGAVLRSTSTSGSGTEAWVASVLSVFRQDVKLLQRQVLALQEDNGKQQLENWEQAKRIDEQDVRIDEPLERLEQQPHVTNTMAQRRVWLRQQMAAEEPEHLDWRLNSDLVPVADKTERGAAHVNGGNENSMYDILSKEAVMVEEMAAVEMVVVEKEVVEMVEEEMVAADVVVESLAAHQSADAPFAHHGTGALAHHAGALTRRASAVSLPKWVTESLNQDGMWMSHSFDEFEIERSVWSAPIVLGMPPIGRAGSVMMFLLFVTNATVQVMSTPPRAPPPLLALRTSSHLPTLYPHALGA